MNTSELFLNADEVFTPFETVQNGRIGISSEGIITSIDTYKTEPEITTGKIEHRGMYIIPGMVDIHVHGGFGVTFGIGELVTDLEKYSRFAASRGVTCFLLSIAGPNTAVLIQIIKDYVYILDNKSEWPGAIPLGLHLEGPFLNPEKHGAYNPTWIHMPDLDEAKAHLDAGGKWIYQVSMAPELPGSEEVARLYADAGVVVSLGHSNTDFKTASMALNGLFTHVTHTYNAQSPLHQREPGVLGAVLASEKATAELIGDSFHVHPAAMKILYRCLGPERIVLITDAMAAAGMPDGEYELLDQKVTVRAGKATLPDGTIGGSTGTMDSALRTMVQLADVPLPDAIRMVSYNPAKVIGMEKRFGSIEIGKEANLTVLNKALKVYMTIVKGKCVYSSQEKDK